MTKTTSPLMIPAEFSALDAWDLSSQALRSHVLNEFPFTVSKQTECWLLALNCESPARPRWIFSVTYDSECLSPYTKKLKRDHDLASLAASIESAKSLSSAWDALISKRSIIDPLALHLPSTTFAGGKDITFTADPENNPEKNEIATLRKEVEGLKQQVAFLTGLVNLRVEPTPDPLAASRSRGANYKKNELANVDNLNLESASKYAGRSDRVINMERKRGWLYALVPEGNTRGYRYPKWQFDVPASRLRAILDILTPSPLSCWSLHNFLTRPHSDLDGKSPSAALADSTFAIERIIDVARRRVDLQQGAS